MDASAESAGPRRRLTVYDAASVIVGIIVGAGLFESLPRIAASAGSPGMLLALFASGGVLALAGALIYAELASRHPDAGGEYSYLRRAFGPRTAFVFAWCQLLLVRPGSTGAMAVVFGRYADSLFDLGPDGPLIYAVASIILLTIVHILGVEPGRWTQNLLTAAKLLGLGLVLGAGLLSSGAPPAQAAAPGQANLFLAAIFVLFAYGGWNEMAYVAAEVRDPARSIPRAILLGVGLVIAVYLLVAAGALRALGFAGLCQSEVMARDVVQQFLGPFSGGFVSTLICLSTLGAVHGMLFTGARLGYALGRTHLAFAPLARWNRTFGTPAVSLAAQGALTLALALAAQALRPADPFEGLTIATTPAYWAFVLLVFAAALVFRLRDRRDQPAGHYRAPFFPAVIALATVAVVALLIGAANYALATRPPEFLLFAGVLLLGLALAAAFPPSPGEHGPSAP